MKKPLISITVCGLLAFATPAFAAELQLANVFSDHAVLQRNVAVPVWGTATPRTTVTVEFAGQKKDAIADDHGSWILKLDPLPANTAGSQLSVHTDQKKLLLNDLLVGDVWYASGQSNMQMTIAACAKKLPAIRELVSRPKSRWIRTLRIHPPDAESPLRDLPESSVWETDTLQNRQKQSAVAYFFATKLHDTLQVPVGIIEGSWGGKPIEGFIPKDHFKTDPALKPILELAEANDLEKLKQIEGGVIIRNTAGRPGRIFNARVAPVAPYALKGFIWYQGESNAGNGEDPRNYRRKMQALVEGWRTTWNESDSPFLFVQLPAFKNESSGWVRLREEQRRSLQIPNTAMAVTIDLRDTDIHPANKFDVGNRLALCALAKSYGQSISYSGPLFVSSTVQGDQVRIRFDHVEQGLMVARKEGLMAPAEQVDVALAHFELCDSSGHWHSAQARIEDKTVTVTSQAVPQPVAVRYACQGAPENANLYNRAGLPASPFCSDLSLLPWQDAK